MFKSIRLKMLGAIDFLSKPFTTEQIRSIVGDVLNREVLVEGKLEGYKMYLEYAKKCILERKYDKAEEYLKKAIIENLEGPEPHNLLGVIAEFEGKIQLAQKHYRAALSFDPTYKPADINLARTAKFYYSSTGIALSDETEKPEDR